MLVGCLRVCLSEPSACDLPFVFFAAAYSSCCYFQAKLEEAEAQAAASNHSSDRYEQLEAEIAQLLEERAQLQAAQQETLRSEGQARAKLQEEHDEAVRALEAAISDAMDAVELKESELTELSEKRDELSGEVRRAGEQAKVAADRLAAAEGGVRELEQRLAEADEAVRLHVFCVNACRCFVGTGL